MSMLSMRRYDQLEVCIYFLKEEIVPSQSYLTKLILIHVGERYEGRSRLAYQFHLSIASSNLPFHFFP